MLRRPVSQTPSAPVLTRQRLLRKAFWVVIPFWLFAAAGLPVYLRPHDGNLGFFLLYCLVMLPGVFLCACTVGLFTPHPPWALALVVISLGQYVAVWSVLQVVTYRRATRNRSPDLP